MNALFSSDWLSQVRVRLIWLPLVLFVAELTTIFFLGWGKLGQFRTNPSLLISLIAYMPFVVRGFIIGALVMCFLLYRNWSKSTTDKVASPYQPAALWIALNLFTTALLMVFFITIPSQSEFNAQPIGLSYFLYLATPFLWLLWFISAVAWFYPPNKLAPLVRANWKLALIIVVISLSARGTIPGELPLEMYNKAFFFWSEVFLKPTIFVSTAISNVLGLHLEYWDGPEGLPTFGNSVFSVGIDGECSGYEGITLVGVLLGAYCFLERRALKMPQALLIFPIAMLAMFLLNSIRLIILLQIGIHWSPEIALKGFHMVAGWVNLVTTLIVAALFLNKSAFFARPAEGLVGGPGALFTVQASVVIDNKLHHASAPSQNSLVWEAPENLKYLLMPMVLWIGVSLVTQMFSLEFRWLYPLSVLIIGGFLYHYRDSYAFISAPLSGLPILVGILVFVIWVVLIPPDVTASAKFETSLFSVSPVLTALWLIFRIVGTTVMVPILEELAFRGFMQPQIQAYVQNSVGVPRTIAIVAALALTSLAFGLMHSDWVAGTAAGVLYGFIRLWRGRVGDAILAHAVTNFILAMYVLFFGYWSYF